MNSRMFANGTRDVASLISVMHGAFLNTQEC
uniref:Uncharacterized protein n=1 Tax=Anguilla anguilla TaxID=7936 RepID=A0A0E9PTR4_ANGAN